MVFGDHRHRVAEIGEHLEARPRRLQLPLDRLVAIRHTAAGEHLRSPRPACQLALQQLGGARLHHDPALEIEPGIESQILVVRAGITVGTTVLAAAGTD